MFVYSIKWFVLMCLLNKIHNINYDGNNVSLISSYYPMFWNCDLNKNP